MIFEHEILEGGRALADCKTSQQGQFLAKLDPLDDTRGYQVEIWLKGGRRLTDQISVSVQGQVKVTRSVHERMTFAPDMTSPVTLSVAGYRGDLRVKLTPDGDTVSPRRLALLAYRSDPAWTSAALDTARLDSFHLPDPSRPQPWFTLNETRLDRGVLEDEPRTHRWQNILTDATEIEVSRGISYDGMTGKGETGTLTGRFYNALDPRSSGIVRGTQVRLLDVATRETMFTGRVRSTVSTPAKDGTYTVTIHAADRGLDLAQTVKYQDTRRAPAAWETVARELLADHPTSIDPAPGRPLIGSVVREASLTEYVDQLAATAGVTWYVDRRNVIQFKATPPTGNVAELVADTPPYTLGPRLHLSDATAVFDTSKVISHVEATNHEAARSSDGWEDHTRTVRASSPTNFASYGENRVSLDTVAADHGQLARLLDRYMDAYEPAQVVSSATIIPWHEAHHIRRPKEIKELVSLDILDAVATSYRNEQAKQHITRITHQITPTSWRTRLDLTQWRN